MHRRLLLPAWVVPLLVGGCLNVKTEPIEVKPIHITVDVNGRVEKLDIDLSAALERKLADAAANYPADVVRGQARKYDTY